MNVFHEYGINPEDIEVLKPLEPIKPGKYAGEFSSIATSTVDEVREGVPTGNKLVSLTLGFTLEVKGVLRKLSKRIYLPLKKETEWDREEVLLTTKEGVSRTEYDLNTYKFSQLKTWILDIGVDPEYAGKVEFEEMFGLPVWVFVYNNQTPRGETYSNISKVMPREEGEEEELSLPVATSKFGF